MEGPLFTKDPEPVTRRDLQNAIGGGRATGRPERGGRIRRRGELNPAERLWTIDEMEAEAQFELQSQLRHADPKIRRDAAKEMLDMLEQKKDETGPTEIAYLSPVVASLEKCPHCKKRLVTDE